MPMENATYSPLDLRDRRRLQNRLSQRKRQSSLEIWGSGVGEKDHALSLDPSDCTGRDVSAFLCGFRGLNSPIDTKGRQVASAAEDMALGRSILPHAQGDFEMSNDGEQNLNFDSNETLLDMDLIQSSVATRPPTLQLTPYSNPSLNVTNIHQERQKGNPHYRSTPRSITSEYVVGEFTNNRERHHTEKPHEKMQDALRPNESSKERPDLISSPKRRGIRATTKCSRSTTLYQKVEDLIDQLLLLYEFGMDIGLVSPDAQIKPPLELVLAEFEKRPLSCCSDTEGTYV
ncbi:hypothetical protein UA08_05971 [Talaromyces atroroseus]|uniref:Uncharacterized protein n=1 Tax=Talaromyces atroroseus TaxID=1441469 RepID=A0A225AD15_TALAT|nr:hypothetical protein UA08_05971 [Talaromyces atroroseus]OKL59051.1 hypothetical protein UA08_05971 [Talaromyces atroroseus]